MADSGCAPVDQIHVPDRIRRDLGDIESLAKSIEELGLLHPIVVLHIATGHYVLVAGERRLVACKMLGWKEIPIRCLPNQLRAREAEVAENQERKAFEPEEIGRVAALLWGEVSPEPGQTRRDAVGAVFGVSGVHAERCKRLVEALPDFPQLSELMSQRGAKAAERELRRLEMANAEPAESEPLDEGNGKGKLVLHFGRQLPAIQWISSNLSEVVDGFGSAFIETPGPHSASCLATHLQPGFRSNGFTPLIWEYAITVLTHVVRAEDFSSQTPRAYRGDNFYLALRGLIETHTGPGDVVRDCSPREGTLAGVCHGRRYVCGAAPSHPSR